MSMRKNFFVLAIAGIGLAKAATARAHDMKVMASRLVTATGETDTVYISYGHILPVDAQIDGDTLDDYSLKTPSGSVVYLKEGVSLHANEVHVEEDGVSKAVATRKPAVYTEVVDGKGNHTHIRGPKTSVKEGTVDHAELQSHQFSKALLVSGTKVDKAVEPLGHELEIVPMEAPFHLAHWPRPAIPGPLQWQAAAQRRRGGKTDRFQAG